MAALPKSGRNPLRLDFGTTKNRWIGIANEK